MDEDTLAQHFVKVPSTGDGDCWINSVLLNYSEPPTVRVVRKRIKEMVADNAEFQKALNVSKQSIRNVTQTAPNERALSEGGRS